MPSQPKLKAEGQEKWPNLLETLFEERREGQGKETWGILKYYALGNVKKSLFTPSYLQGWVNESSALGLRHIRW